MAGRDIGTVVLPDAPVKIYLTASVAARVARRRAQLEEAGVDVERARWREEIEERDRLDRNARRLAARAGARRARHRFEQIDAEQRRRRDLRASCPRAVRRET